MDQEPDITITIAEAARLLDMKPVLVEHNLRIGTFELTRASVTAYAPIYAERTAALAELVGLGEEIEDLAGGLVETEIPEQYRWNSDDEDVSDERRGVAP